MKTLKTMMAIVAISAAVAAASVDIEFVTVGDAGNIGDNTGYGTVDYTYNISKYEITNAQYAQFLNSVAASQNSHNLWFQNMKITQTYTGNGYAYAPVPGHENKPATYIQFENALRFANWLHNDQPVGTLNEFTTEDGAYDIASGSYLRSEDAKFFLPDMNEWYKAAYYKSGATDAGYWDYATQSDVKPSAQYPPGNANSANFQGVTPEHGDHFFDVGAYTNSDSAYGTFDQNGSAWEWTESFNGQEQVIVAGGSYSKWDSPDALLAGQFVYFNTTRDLWSCESAGIRIAAVPEPATMFLMGLGAVAFIRKKTNSKG